MNNQGFSIIEWLMIASITAVVASLAIIAIDPIGRGSEAANAKRWSDVNVLSSAITRYQSDHAGTPPGGVDSAEREICAKTGNGAECTEKGLLDMSELIGAYLNAIPTDPSSLDGLHSGYRVRFSPENRIIVNAPNAANGEHIAIGE